MASILKVDTIQDQDGNNIINESANTITIGASGDTITIPSGATFASVGIDDNATSTAITIDSSQKVGIANTIPGSFNSSANQLVVGSGSGQNGITIYSGTSTNGSIHFGDGTGASSYRGSINYYHNGDTLGFNVGASERMRLTSTGVGIGTSSPTYILDVVGGTNTAKFKGRIVNIDGAAASDSPRVNLSLDSTDKAQLLLHRTSDDLQLGTLVNSDSIFITNNTERMRLTSTGLGIGTSSPDDKLHVADSTSAELKLQTDNANNGSAIKFNRSGTDYSYIGTKGYFTGTSDNNLYLRANSGLGIQFYTNGNNERMRIASDGKVGINTSSPAQTLSIIGNAQIENTSASGNAWYYAKNADRTWLMGIRGSSSDALSFYDLTADAERMQINSSGDVKIGEGTGATFTVRVTPGAGVWGIDAGVEAGSFSRIRISSSGTGTQTKMAFLNTNGEVGSITTSGTSTAFNTSSDYRLKENLNYDFDATTRLKQLRPARFNFIADADTTVDGFLAHEVQSVVPEAITGTKDAIDEDGNPVYQGIDQSKLVPLLVKTIQELEARITALETNQP